METNGITSAASSTKFVDATSSGFGGLKAEDFMKMLITQLQNQDPTEPMGNDELLSQLSSMQNLQSNVELSKTLNAFAANQQLASASSFIGKTVSGIAANRDTVTGVADRAFLKGTEMFLGIGDKEVPMSSITSVRSVA